MSGPETESRRAEFNSVRSDKVSRSDTLQTWAVAGQFMAVARWKAAAEEAIAKNDGEAEQWKEPMWTDMI